LSLIYSLLPIYRSEHNFSSGYNLSLSLAF
jgi:hypothetical protein